MINDVALSHASPIAFEAANHAALITSPAVVFAPAALAALTATNVNAAPIAATMAAPAAQTDWPTVVQLLHLLWLVLQ